MRVVVAQADLLRGCDVGNSVQQIKAAVVAEIGVSGEDASGQRVLFRYMFVDLDHQPVLVDLRRLRAGYVINQSVVVRHRKKLQDVLRNLAEPGKSGGDYVSGKWVTHLVLVAVRPGDRMSRKWIVNRTCKYRPPCRIEHRLTVSRQLRS